MPKTLNVIFMQICKDIHTRARVCKTHHTVKYLKFALYLRFVGLLAIGIYKLSFGQIKVLKTLYFSLLRKHPKAIDSIYDGEGYP